MAVPIFWAEVKESRSSARVDARSAILCDGWVVWFEGMTSLSLREGLDL